MNSICMRVYRQNEIIITNFVKLTNYVVRFCKFKFGLVIDSSDFIQI